MSAVSETIVREFFELHGFLVRQQRKHLAPNRRDDEEFDFYVMHPKPAAAEHEKLLPFVLGAEDLPSVRRAVVVVKGWHTETFSPGLLAHAPEIYRFGQPSIFKQAEKFFGPGDSLTKILVVPALPADAETCRHSVDLLRAKGVDAVILFRTMLAGLIERTEINRNYQKSDLLQVIRILKNYGFFKDPQMELFGSESRPARREP